MLITSKMLEENQATEAKRNFNNNILNNVKDIMADDDTDGYYFEFLELLNKVALADSIVKKVRTLKSMQEVLSDWIDELFLVRFSTIQFSTIQFSTIYKC